MTNPIATFRTASLATILLLSLNIVAQQSPSNRAAVSPSVVPNVVSFNGTLTDSSGKPRTGIVGITFLLYKDAAGGAPLWLETQNVTPDENGHYSVQLGSTTSTGLPPSMFVSGEARWLGIQVAGEAEQPRVLLVAVPYAMKAADAETLGGLPASAFVLAMPAINSSSSSAAAATPASASTISTVPATSNVTTSGGTVGTLPLWSTTTNIQSSVFTQTGTGATAKVGIGTTTPASTLDIKGTEIVRGSLSLPNIANATTLSGSNSQPLNLVGSSFSSSSNAAVTQSFRWQVEPVANNTASASGSLNLLFGAGRSTVSETGLAIASNGVITFAPTQTFPGTGKGTVTSVAAGTGLTGGNITTSGSLAIDPTVIPQLSAANTFTGNQTVNGNLSATGVVTGSAYQIGSSLFAFGQSSANSAYLGFAGNTTTSATFNTGVGFGALVQVTTGGQNTAIGAQALSGNLGGSANTAVGYESMMQGASGVSNTAVGNNSLQVNTGNLNSAFGASALSQNTSGVENAAVGGNAMLENTTGGGNAAVGAFALGNNTTGIRNIAIGLFSGSNHNGTEGTFLGYQSGAGAGNLTNVTALGTRATVSESNALVLGATGSSAVAVGIGTATPFNDYDLTLDATTNSTINGGVVVNGGGGNLYLGMTKGVHKFRVDLNGVTYSDGGYQSSGADFAESVAVRGARSEYEPGDVLEIDAKAHRGVSLSRHPYATLVAGIYSTKPGLLATPHTIDDPTVKTKEIPLAIVGIVPCKVTTENGAIKAGDLLVTSSRPGYAMKGTERRRMLGAVVGKALEPLAHGAGLIEVLVTLQ